MSVAPYDPLRYWHERLSANDNLVGVGHRGFSCSADDFLAPALYRLDALLTRRRWDHSGDLKLLVTRHRQEKGEPLCRQRCEH